MQYDWTAEHNGRRLPYADIWDNHGHPLFQVIRCNTVTGRTVFINKWGEQEIHYFPSPLKVVFYEQ